MDLLKLLQFSDKRQLFVQKIFKRGASLILNVSELEPWLVKTTETTVALYYY